MLLIKDEQYYMEDGNCTFRVNDHLFKIHQYLLTRESPFFEKMFTLPQESRITGNGEEIVGYNFEGSSDENPIVCQDSVNSFQAFCWGLYIRPTGVREQEDPAKVDLGRLISLASLTHKYELTLLEKWAVVVLQKHWMSAFGSPEKSKKSPVWSWDNIGRFLVLSTKTDAIAEEFKNAIELQLLSLINNGEDLPNIQSVLNFADDFPSRYVYGQAYYRILRRLDVFNLSRVLDSSGASDNKLTPNAFQNTYKIAGMTQVSHDQRLKLLHGFWCLVSLRTANSLGRVQFECTCPSPSPASWAIPPKPTPKPSSKKRSSGIGLWDFPPGGEIFGSYSPKVEGNSDGVTSQPNCSTAWKTLWVGVHDTLDFGAMLEEARHGLEDLAKEALKDPCKKRLGEELRALFASFEENLFGYFILP